MKYLKIAWLAAAILIVAAFLVPLQGQAQEGGVDHSQFPPLQGPFEKPQEVTAACLSCHTEAADQVMGTVHWTWEYENEIVGETVGKDNVINNYCIAVETNERRCTSCHIGYGWKDDSFDFEDSSNIDCLVCHDTTGTYKKFPPGAGMPVVGEAVQFGGKTWEPVDLANVAQNIGQSSRATCGACHFTGGGGDGVKHGDLDRTMLSPEYEVDVHMSPDGADMSCTACHVTQDHEISGGRYVMSWASDGLATCTTCHNEAPHEGESEALNQHVEVIACQTCHIPEYARGANTMLSWDWTEAGQPKPDGGYPWIVSEEINGQEEHVYDSRKGAFTWGMNVVPTYMWSNGVFDYTLLEDGVDAETGFIVNQVLGEQGDGKIWPFKEFTGIQPYDPVNEVVGIPHLMPYPGHPDPKDETAFWANWDMDLALQEGLAARGIEYSGSYEQIESVMYWPITHQVAPADQALGCTSCHDPEGRLDFAALGYSPDQVTVLTSFPPAAPEAEEAEEIAEEVEEAEPAESMDEAPEEETGAEPEAADSSASAGVSPIVTIGAIASLVAIVVFVIFQRRKQNA